MDDRSKRVIRQLATALGAPYHGSSSMTPAVYDTAWVAMVSKQETGDEDAAAYWLFPECFQYILSSQSPTGAFGVHSALVDGILNTMSAVLALSRYAKSPSVRTSCPLDSSGLAESIERGRAYLAGALKSWEVLSTVHVGFEVLVPCLLRLLQDEGFTFQFPGHNDLMAMNRRKMDKIKPSIFYTDRRTTLLHSMEAFIGIIDFDRTRHHLTNGSMMGSPSSTAAYLMHSSQWNDEAERYLRFVVAAGSGCVPSAFPISIFETSWVISTLVASGFTADDLGADETSKLADFLESQLEEQAGTTGFAPGFLPDADDTAKSIYALNLLGRPTSCQRMIEAFETPAHFKTYDCEMNESFSANCNVLVAILSCEDPSKYIPQILKAVTYLSESWFHGKWSDKWNVDPHYPMMLFSDALVRLLRLWDAGSLPGLGQEDLMPARLVQVALQILIRTLSSQSEHGSWRDSTEVTAYALLTLKTVASLPCTTAALRQKVEESIQLGTGFLQSREALWGAPELLWVEKVTYGSSILAETYCLAAIRATTRARNWGDRVLSACKFPEKEVERFSHFFSRLPLFATEPLWRLRASIVEGFMFAPMLNRARVELDIFPPQVAEAGKYLEYIPFTWTTCNNATDFGMSPQSMSDMMIISMLNFQVDKWLEEIMNDPRLHGDFAGLRSIIRRILAVDNPNEGFRSNDAHIDHRKPTNGTADHILNGTLNGTTTTNGTTTSEDKTIFLRDTEKTLSRFLGYVLGHAKVTAATAAARHRLRHELMTFLEAHVTQGEDNYRLKESRQEQQGCADAGRTYYDWVRTTSADHTSCPYSYAFYLCLISSPQSPSGGSGGCISGAKAQYLSQDLCRHLATMCRQYNDYGSVARDRDEKNLNSINFAEFRGHEGSGEVPGDQLGDDVAKNTLLDLANYERECLDLAAERLRAEIAASTWRALRVFIHVTDLYGQIYVVRDINASMAKSVVPGRERER